MKKTIYLHIGLSKTGTTTLQQFCAVNANLLEKSGLFYPIIDEGDNNGNVIFQAALKVCKGQYVKHFIAENPHKFQQAMREIWSKFVEKIEASSAQKILISSESLGAYPFVFWQFVDHSKYDVKLVVYVRNSVDHSISYFKQHAKRGQHNLYERNLNKFVKDFDRGYFYEIINEYGDYLGESNVILRPFEKQMMKNHHIIDDFFAAIGFEIPLAVKRISDENISPSHDTTVLYNFLKMTMMSCNSYSDQFFKSEFGNFDIGTQKTENLVAKEIIKEVCDKYYEKDCQLAQRFLARDELFSDRYPKYYYQEKQQSCAIMISYQQLDLLYREINNLIERKQKRFKPIIDLISYFIKDETAKKKFRAKYLGEIYGIYKNISFVSNYLAESKERFD